ncbi:MAG: SAM-dependent methyltransferase, partial [Smithella sp.]
EVSQTIILTRTSGRTPLPKEQELAELARSRATLCIYLSGRNVEKTIETLVPYYGVNCPAAVIFHVSWPDEEIVRGTLGDIVKKVEKAALGQTSIILVGHALSRDIPVSKLYDAKFSHGFRKGTEAI